MHRTRIQNFLDRTDTLELGEQNKWTTPFLYLSLVLLAFIPFSLLITCSILMLAPISLLLDEYNYTLSPLLDHITTTH